jgi:branched-chain amino acid transport system ATP-binding protein
MSDAVLLEVLNLEAAYGPVKAVRGVSLKVRDGSIATVLGPNGAGKTTLLKTLSGITDPKRGSVRFAGTDLTGWDPSAIVGLGLVQVPEGREVFPLLSVRDNLLMGAYLRRDRDAVARDLESVQAYFPILRERAAQDAGLLSGGQQQMLAIARAIMAAPKMILLDEPSLGLSPKLTQDIFGIIRRINAERGTTLLVVEQNAHLALGLADDGFILENGRIVAEGPCAELRERPDIQEFYLGLASHGARGERRWKRKKSWQ